MFGYVLTRGFLDLGFIPLHVVYFFSWETRFCFRGLLYCFCWFSYEFHTSLADSCCCFVNDSRVHHLPHDADSVGIGYLSILGGWSNAWEVELRVFICSCYFTYLHYSVSSCKGARACIGLDFIILYCKTLFLSNKDLVFLSNKIISVLLSCVPFLLRFSCFYFPLLLTSRSDH